MMPTRQEIDEFVSRAWLRGQIAFEDGHMLDRIAEAARRGVEADQTIAIWQVEIRDRNETIASLKAALAALKAAQPEEYPSSADDEATRWRHGEKL